MGLNLSWTRGSGCELKGKLLPFAGPSIVAYDLAFAFLRIKIESVRDDPGTEVGSITEVDKPAVVLSWTHLQTDGVRAPCKECDTSLTGPLGYAAKIINFARLSVQGSPNGASSTARVAG
jgi:hypothetical protein